MRDAPRANPRNYRKEEWIAYNVDAKKSMHWRDGKRADGSLCAR
jgi:hypothetical protein